MKIIICVLFIALILIFDKVNKQRSYQNNKSTGNVGEAIVAKMLEELPSEFTVLNNVHYRKCQIDHLVIHHGDKIIFVIETKMWGGVVSGKSDDTYWTQDKDGQVKYFMNPTLQNKYHCKLVRRKYKGYDIKGIVVFVKNSRVPRYSGVIRETELLDYINGVYNKIYNRVIIDR